MQISKTLRDYLAAKHANDWGWLSKFEEGLHVDNAGPEKWPRLAGIYNNLLDEALDLIPPCILKEAQSEITETTEETAHGKT